MEETIIQSLILDEEYFGKVYPFLKNLHFSNLEVSEIFSSLQQYIEKYEKSPNPTELGLYIKNNNTTAEALKPSVIEAYKNLMLNEEVNNKEFLIKETEKYIQRIELSDAIMASSEIIENDEPFEAVIGLVEQALSITFDTNTGLNYGDSIEDRYLYYTEKVIGIKCGIPSVDKALGDGYRKKTLNLIVAPSHGGKSARLVADSANMLISGKNVLFVTLEMPEYEIARRIDANLLNIPANDLGKMNKKEFSSRLKDIKELSGELIIKEYSAGAFNTIKLKSLMTELETEGFVPDAIVIDYITLMSSSRTTLAKIGGTYSFYKLIAEELHGFGKTEDKVMLSAAQLNRGSYDNLEAGLDSIADSLGVIQTADTVQALLTNGQLREMNQLINKFLKNRNTGELSSQLLEAIFETMRFTDLDEGFNKEKGTVNAMENINAEVLLQATQAAAGTNVDASVMNFN